MLQDIFDGGPLAGVQMQHRSHKVDELLAALELEVQARVQDVLKQGSDVVAVEWRL
jgi:hypothetical protein